MTTSLDLNINLETEVEEAMETRDIQSLFRLARIVKKQGNDEFAEVLMDIAKRYEREEAYDNN